MGSRSGLRYGTSGQSLTSGGGGKPGNPRFNLRSTAHPFLTAPDHMGSLSFSEELRYADGPET